jgi:hypothetical protein
MIDDVASLLESFVTACHRAGIAVPGIMLERDTDVTPGTVLPDLLAIDDVLEKGRAHALDHCA